MEKKYIVIGGSVLALAMIVLIVLNGGFTDKTYYCENLNFLKECDHLSSTSARCYPYSQNNSGYKKCIGGINE